MDNYIINEKTLAIIGIDEGKCRVVEENSEFICCMSIEELFDVSCLYYGSSFQGRVDASKRILNRDYKVPVLIRESDVMIFFQIGVKSMNKCMWISLNNLRNYVIFDSKIEIIFNEYKSLCMNIKVDSFEGQLLKAYNLKHYMIFRCKN